MGATADVFEALLEIRSRGDSSYKAIYELDCLRFYRQVEFEEKYQLSQRCKEKVGMLENHRLIVSCHMRKDN
jgi:hypothetical protein